MTEIDEALAAFGGRAARLIAERENAVYAAELPGGKAAIRLHRPGYQTPAAIRSELDWMAALAKAGVRVPAPLGGPVTLSTGRLATAVRWVEGTPLGEGGAPLPGSALEQIERFRAVGRAVARQDGNDLSFDILEPHDPSLKDNCDKAVGLARFAEKYWSRFDRIQLIRKKAGADGAERFFRLDVGKDQVRKKVLAVTSNAQLDQVFDDLAETR